MNTNLYLLHPRHAPLAAYVHVARAGSQKLRARQAVGGLEEPK